MLVTLCVGLKCLLYIALFMLWSPIILWRCVGKAWEWHWHGNTVIQKCTHTSIDKYLPTQCISRLISLMLLSPSVGLMVCWGASRVDVSHFISQPVTQSLLMSAVPSLHRCFNVQGEHFSSGASPLQQLQFQYSSETFSSFTCILNTHFQLSSTW